MAHKSRKQQQATAPAADLTIRAALYIRLSVDDKKTGSISIETQKLILNHYLESKPEIFVYDTYIDNGATGTNFHRPGFQQMLSDIEAGLNTIARRLNEAGIVSVSVYKQQIGQITHENLIGNGKWQTRMVNKILRRETYTGDLV